MKCAFGLVLALSVLIFIEKPIYANDDGGAFYISPFVGGYSFDNALDLDTAPVYGIRVGYEMSGKSFSDSLNLENVLGTGKTKSKATNDSIPFHLLRVEAVYKVINETSVEPHLSVGAGAIFMDGEDVPEEEPVINFGVGFRYEFSSNIEFRGDLRSNLYLVPENDQDLELTIGFNYLFGKEDPHQEKRKKDSDHDGISDVLDQCPDTAEGIEVDQSGCSNDADGDGVNNDADRCPETTSGIDVDPMGCPRDTDGDGVPDYSDRCTDTPAGRFVDESGCSRDVNRDGGTDGLGPGPDTKARPRADERGVPESRDGTLDVGASSVAAAASSVPGAAGKGAEIGSVSPLVVAGLEKIVVPLPTGGGAPVVEPLGTISGAVSSQLLPKPALTGLQKADTPHLDSAAESPAVAMSLYLPLTVPFEFDRADIRADFEAELQEVARLLSSFTDTNILIEGHTDNRGSRAYNQRLSERRAENVRRYLVKHGHLRASNIRMRGYGEDRPIADNATDEGRRKNRRVLITTRR